MQLTRRNIIKGAGALAGASALTASTATPSLAYNPYPSRGSGGTFENRDALGYKDAQGIQSYYHLRTAHLAGKQGPFPLVVHLHGDGGYEYRNPNTWTSPLYGNVAKSINAVYLIPRTPQTGNGYTWWRSYSSTTWLRNFINWEMRYYNIDKKRIFISGFSGGAQIASYNLVADYNNIFQGGGAMMLGGGGTSGMAITQTPSASVKSNFLMRWHVGGLDDGRNTSDGFDALAASKIGYDTYTNAGWNTKRVLIPGEDHNGSEEYGPNALKALVNESQVMYGLPTI